jgi:hypothetical protein
MRVIQYSAAFAMNREAAAYWIAWSSRTTTVVIVVATVVIACDKREAFAQGSKATKFGHSGMVR